MSSRRHTFAAAIATIFAATCWATLSGQTGGYSSSTNRLSGTYELDRSRSDDATRLAQQATRSLPSEQRDRAYQNLRARLDAPDQLTIDLQGRSVAIASSAAPRLDFVADGRNRTEVEPEWPDRHDAKRRPWPGPQRLDDRRSRQQLHRAI